MGMSMYISPIRKRILWALGLTQIEKDKFIDLDSKDVDGVSLDWIEGFEVNETEEFCREGGMINWLRNNIGLPPKYFGINHSLLVCTIDDIKRLLLQVEYKTIRLYYESEEEYLNGSISNSRMHIMSKLEDIIERHEGDYYYYIVSWY